MRKTLPIIGLMILLCAYLNAQGLKYKYLKEVGDKKEVVFSIVGINDDAHCQQIQKAFFKYSEVLSCKIFYNKRCKIIVDASVETEYADRARKILKENGVDFDPDYVISLNKATYLELANFKASNPDKYRPDPIPSSEWVYPDELQKIIADMELKGDKEQLAKAKQDWIEDHPEAYKKMTGVEYLDYSIELSK